MVRKPKQAILGYCICFCSVNGCREFGDGLASSSRAPSGDAGKGSLIAGGGLATGGIAAVSNGSFGTAVAGENGGTMLPVAGEAGRHDIGGAKGSAGSPVTNVAGAGGWLSDAGAPAAATSGWTACAGVSQKTTAGGDGNTGGVAGVAGVATGAALGIAGRTSAAGSAGVAASNSAGTAGSIPTPPEAMPNPPYCWVDRSPTGYFRALDSVVRSADVAVSITDAGNNCLQLYMSQPAHQVMAITWEQALGNQSDYIPWQCLDSLPNPRRVTAMNMINRKPEIVITTSGGHLFVHRPPMGINSEPWMEVDIPESNSIVQDVYNLGVSTKPDRLYVADRGVVFRREKGNADPYSAYGPWQSYGAVGAMRIAAGIRLDGIEQVFVVNGLGVLKTLVDPDHVRGTTSELWREISTPEPVADLDCAFNNAPVQMLTLFAVGVSGAVYRQVHLTGDTWGIWQIVKAAEAPPVLTTIAVSRVPATGPALFGVDSNGVVQFLDRTNQWRALP